MRRDTQSWLIDILLAIAVLFYWFYVRQQTYVYVMYDKASKLSKIGYAVNVDSRYAELKRYLPELELVTVFKFKEKEQAISFERAAHRRYKSDRTSHSIRFPGYTEFFKVDKNRLAKELKVVYDKS